MPNSDWERGYSAGYAAAHRTDVRDITTDRGESVKTVKVKRTRKPSRYNLEYKKQYAILKKKHPRSKFAALAKKAHTATRKAMKK